MNKHIQFGAVSNQKLVSRIFWWSILALAIVVFGFIPGAMVLSSMGDLTAMQGYSVVLRIQYYIKLIGVPLVSIVLLKLGCDVLYKILKRVDPEDGTKNG